MNKALVSPVGAVWHYIRQHYPAIELYSADESHPSVSGTFAAAACFYSILFRKNPALCNFTAGLPAAEADNIRLTVKLVVFDSLTEWYTGKYDPKAAFSYNQNQLNVNFQNNSQNADSFSWDFGDSQVSGLKNPDHVYADSGSYRVRLTVVKCGRADTFTEIISLHKSSSAPTEKEAEFIIRPNPAGEQFCISSDWLKGRNVIFTIRDAGGRFMQSLASDGNAVQNLTLRNIPAGFYILEIVSGAKVVNRIKLVKKD